MAIEAGLSESQPPFRSAVAAAKRWIVAITVAWTLEQVVQHVVVAIRGQYTTADLIALLVTEVIATALEVVVASIIVVPVVGIYYLFVRSRTSPRFWASRAPWRRVLLRSAGIGAFIGVLLGAYVNVPANRDNVVSEATPLPSPIPAIPNRDELKTVVNAIFARNVAGPKSHARPLLSPAFIANKTMFGRFYEIAAANEVKPRIDDIHGRTVDLTIAYALIADNKSNLRFTRHDTWTFVHGSAGWLLDSMIVNDKVLQSLLFSDGTRQNVEDSHFDSASGTITFSIRGSPFAWIPQKNFGWKIANLSTPTPAQATPPAGAVDVPGQTQPGPVYDVPSAPRRAYVPPDPYSDCSTETIEEVSSDGAVVKLIDGRRYLVQESERYLTALWLAAEDVTLCDPGPGTSAKIIHDGDVVYAGHLE